MKRPRLTSLSDDAQSGDLALARDRFQQSARLRRRVLWRLWAGNRAMFLGCVGVSLGTLAGSAWIFAQVLGNGIVARTWGPGIAIGGLLMLARATGVAEFLQRSQHEEKTARELYE